MGNPIRQGNALALRPLNRQDCKTLGLASLGGALEFYDFIIFVFFTAVLGTLFFPPDMPDALRQIQTFSIFAAGYLARPLGGIAMAHFGDLLGRKKIFTLSILMMALSTLMIGLLPTYQQIGIFAPIGLLTLRILQGAAIGGEVPGAWVFVAEHAPERHTGLACNLITSGLMLGILLGALLAMVMNSLFSPDELEAWAWRVPFLIGGLFGLIAVYLRKWLHETPVFLELQAKKHLAAELPLKQVLRDHRFSIAVSMLATFLFAGTIIITILMTPAYLQKQFAVLPLDALRANCYAIVALSLGCVVAGWASDKLGSGLTMLISNILLGCSSYAFYHSLSHDTSQLLLLYPLMGFAVGMGAVPLLMIKAFPAAIRFSGLSFSYNVAYAFAGGLTPVILSFWIKYDVLAPSYYLMLLSVIGAGLGGYLIANQDQRLKHSIR